MKIKLIAAASVFALTVACSTKKAQVEETLPAPKKEILMTAELTQGKVLFESKCGKCHDLPVPQNYSKEKWTPIMESMYKKARMTEADRDLVYNYVTMGM